MNKVGIDLKNACKSYYRGKNNLNSNSMHFVFFFDERKKLLKKRAKLWAETTEFVTEVGEQACTGFKRLHE